jgi:ATP adenylyltransferase
MERLWAPWRLEYITTADEAEGCFLAPRSRATNEQGLVVARGRQALVVLNKYPYASGHLLVAPARHEDRVRRTDGRGGD